jgi:hypothetical protein
MLKKESISESTDINFMKGDGAEVSYLKRHGSFMGGGKYYKFRGVNINFFVYYNEKNKNYVGQLKLTSGNRPSNDREYDKMYDVLKKLGNERRLGKLDDSDVDIYFENFKTQSDHPAKSLYEQIEGLKNKAEKSGMPYGILKQVYDRGMAAWRGGHRPGTTQQQWAFARVNSFITKSSGTWGGADKDLAAKVKGN